MELPTRCRAGRISPTGLKSIRIDIDPVEMRRYASDAAVVADAKAGTADLVAAVKKAGYSKTSGRRAAIREATAAAQQEIQSSPAADGVSEHPARGAAGQRDRHR